MIERQRRRDGRPAQQREPEEVQQAPGEQEGQPRNEVVLGVEQDDERRQMQQHQHAQCPNDGARRPEAANLDD